MSEIFAENGESCKQKFKFDDFTQSRILSNAFEAAIVEFISESELLIIFCPSNFTVLLAALFTHSLR